MPALRAARPGVVKRSAVKGRDAHPGTHTPVAPPHAPRLARARRRA
jgi:hypothetical protein